MHLGQNPRKLSETYQPVIDCLNRHMPEARFELESARDIAAFEVKFRAREPDLLIPDPWQSLRAM